MVKPTKRRAYLRIRTPKNQLTGQDLADMALQSLPSGPECRAMLLSARKTRLLTQGHLAYLLKLPVVAVGRWERGENEPSIAARQRILEVCRALGVTQ